MTTSIDDVMFSRSVGLSAMGKANSVLKAKVPDEVKDEFVRLAHKAGLTESELLRDMVMLRIYGHEAVARMHADRLRMVAGVGLESAQEQTP